VTPEYASSIGADGYAPDAATAVDVVRSLLARSQPVA
jgi:methanogenic corrinoid protein MtbC1